MYHVYVAYLDDVPRYVGFGREGRWKHVNSGVSHHRKLNYEVLVNERTFDIRFEHVDITDKHEADLLEQTTIAKYGIEADATGTLWNETLGGVGFHARHTQTSKNRISAAHKERWARLKQDPERYNDYIDRTKNTVNTGRFVKGGPSRNPLGGKPKEWILRNIATGEHYRFINRVKFFNDHPNLYWLRNIPRVYNDNSKFRDWHINQVESTL